MTETRTFKVLYPEGKANGKSGTVSSAAMHLFCMMVGQAVLSLPAAASWLGWIAAPILICLVYGIGILSSSMLVSVYEMNGVFHSRYHQAVRHILTPGHALAISIFQFLVLVLISIARVITAAVALKNVAVLVCESNGTASEDCFNPYALFCGIFGAVELFLSLIPSLEAAAWLSYIGSACSMTYIFMTIVLSFTKAGNLGGTIGGRQANAVNKAFNVMSSIGNFMQAFNCAQMLMEIEDTLGQPPAAVTKMKKSLLFAQTSAFILYSLVMVSGYLAFGNDVDGMVLSSFTGPIWALAIANVLLALNMMASFQVVAQGVFETLESHLKMFMLRRELKKDGLDPDEVAASALRTIEEMEVQAAAEASVGKRAPKFSDMGTNTQIQKYSMSMGFNRINNVAIEGRLLSRMSMSRKHPSMTQRGRLTRTYTTNIDEFNENQSKFSRKTTMFQINTGLANEDVPQNSEHYVLPLWMRFVTRSLFVLIVTGVGISLPNFKDVTGFLGAFNFFMLSVFWPSLMYRKVNTLSRRWSIGLWIIFGLVLLMGLVAAIGSIRNIIKTWSTL